MEWRAGAESGSKEQEQAQLLANTAAARAAAGEIEGQNATENFKETRAGASITLCGRALGFPPYESVMVRVRRGVCQVWGGEVGRKECEDDAWI